MDSDSDIREAGRGRQRPKVSGVITSFNEEHNIAECIESLSWCDEIILVDSYSTDRTPEIAQQFMRHLVESGVKDPIVMSGSSDGGAHLASFTGADYSTRLLAEWVPDTISMEDAVWRLTGMPATVHGLQDRGFLRTGAWADIVVFDPDALAASDAYLARDFPAGTERYVSDAEGYAYVIVNGEVLLENGKHTGALPGHVLRSA